MIPHVFTLGHSNHSSEFFVALLKSHGVQVVADVRSQPYSKYSTQFEYEPLKASLHAAGIRYIFLGRELGGRPEGEEFYDFDGRVMYDRVAASKLFQEGVARLERGIREFNVAMLCAEEDPAKCHRRLLVGRVLREHGICVEHIRGDGRVQTEEEVASESDPNSNQLGLFASTEAAPWKSILSVSPKRRQNSSSVS